MNSITFPFKNIFIYKKKTSQNPKVYYMYKYVNNFLMQNEKKKPLECKKKPLLLLIITNLVLSFYLIQL